MQVRLHELAAAGTLATCDMVRLELLRAARDDAEYAQMDARLAMAVLLATDAAAWAEAISLGRRLRRAGVGIDTPDLLIAAVAIAHAATLVHADGIFEGVAQHSALHTEPVFNLL